MEGNFFDLYFDNAYSKGEFLGFNPENIVSLEWFFGCMVCCLIGCVL